MSFTSKNIFFHAHDCLEGSLEGNFERIQVGDRVVFRRTQSERGMRAREIEPASEVDEDDDREFGTVVEIRHLFGFVEPDGTYGAAELDDEYIKRWRARFVVAKETP